VHKFILHVEKDTVWGRFNEDRFWETHNCILTEGSGQPPRGTRRLHAKPSAREVKACKPWLEAEIGVIKPQTIVCLGATAVRAVIGSKARVMKDHGQFLESKLGRTAMPTLHPSAILRADPEDRDDAMALLVTDLRRVRGRLAA